MKKFLIFFLIEFVIIFAIACGGCAFFHVPYNFPQIALTAAISGAIIALVMLKTWQPGSCKK